MDKSFSIDEVHLKQNYSLGNNYKSCFMEQLEFLIYKSVCWALITFENLQWIITDQPYEDKYNDFSSITSAHIFIVSC